MTLTNSYKKVIAYGNVIGEKVQLPLNADLRKKHFGMDFISHKCQ